MISQRNISLLSNRLAAGGGRRIREDVLERDYCLAWFLAVMAESDLKDILCFKGGTALKRCYFGEYRFSEDLDFTLLEPLQLDDLLKRFEPVYSALRQESGITFEFDRVDRHKHSNSYTFYLKYEGPLPSGNNVKVDITKGNTWFSPESKRKFCEVTTSSPTCPVGDCSKCTPSPKWRAKKSWPWPTRQETSPGISTTFGI